MCTDKPRANKRIADVRLQETATGDVALGVARISRDHFVENGNRRGALAEMVGEKAGQPLGSRHQARIAGDRCAIRPFRGAVLAELLLACAQLEEKLAVLRVPTHQRLSQVILRVYIAAKPQIGIN